MTDELMPFQVEGAQWLAKHRYAILGDEMGLGKTPQAVRAADSLGVRRMGIICPAIGRVNWQREFDRWSLLGPDLYIESYDRLATQKKARDEFRAFRPELVIVDEAHYLKNRDSSRTRMMYGQHCHNTGLLSIPKRVWLLTGTPMPNHIGELWTHLRTLWPQLIEINGKPASYYEYLNEFAEWTGTDFGVKVFGNRPEGLPRMRGILKRIMLRRLTRSVLPQLPPIIWAPTYSIEPEVISAELRELEQSDEVAELRRVLAAAETGSTQELYVPTSNPELNQIEDAIELGKVRRLTAVLKAAPVGKLIAEELRDGAYDKIVIFAHHLAALDALRTELAEFSPCEIRGGQTDKSRQAQIDAFQTDPSRRVILVQQRAGYHTITLHAAAQVVFLEQSWTPDENVQAAKRCHRIGQTRPVFVRNFGLVGSVDDAVSQVLSRKAKAILELLEK